MLIVPKADNLAVEAKVAPQDIDQLRLGQTAMLRFSAFNQRTTPEIDGRLSRISADVTTEERSGGSYYTVRIAMDSEDIARLGTVKLVPGMPVEVFVRTGDHKDLVSDLLHLPSRSRVGSGLRPVRLRPSRPVSSTRGSRCTAARSSR